MFFSFHHFLINNKITCLLILKCVYKIFNGDAIAGTVLPLLFKIVKSQHKSSFDGGWQGRIKNSEGPGGHNVLVR